ATEKPQLGCQVADSTRRFSKRCQIFARRQLVSDASKATTETKEQQAAAKPWQLTASTCTHMFKFDTYQYRHSFSDLRSREVDRSLQDGGAAQPVFLLCGLAGQRAKSFLSMSVLSRWPESYSQSAWLRVRQEPA
uniref:Kinesin motor domain-containing protein n=1 Tax=Macrostomum lignano TaxID=282301 RepID=A0A1I8F7A8_9PLAT